MSVHLALLALSCAVLAATVAGGGLIGLNSDSQRVRQVAVVIATALVVGNAVCLLPGAPQWYSVAVTALTAGGLAWAAMSWMVARRSARPVVTTVTGGRPQLTLIPGGYTPQGPVPSSTIQPYDEVAAYDDSESSWDEGVRWHQAVVLAERACVTRQDLDQVGPVWARSQDVYVSRSVGTYAPQAGRRRAAGSQFSARAHVAGGRVTRAQVRSAYEDAPVTSRIRGTRA
ncbi:hypothetical protein KEM60_03073 [Austwickia sp. TVS 96-490-7B]|uniref:hypothetical protein n=1 Tax=Austwickia sp. TVS 96-490-7B TaxID=2830843 RepID=UPI001C56B017|nr:hypothetical protein [Austwickia sp. TVS 96-490-7B]MBW3086844.1 hypothetical protein [Austwickia sp. TVS 96-490-7B]